MKLISCICPSKRSIADLQRTIDNFLAQTYPCKELIVLRTDFAYPKTASEDVYYHNVPHGLSIGELRNVAIRLSRGSVLGHYDDDDLSHPERLARSMAAIDAGASLVGSSRVIYERKTHDGWPPGHPASPPIERWLFDGGALTPKYLVGGTLVYRRELWEARNFRDVEVGEDTRWQWEQRGPDWPEKWVDLQDENLYTARISADATSPKDTGSPGWSRL